MSSPVIADRPPRGRAWWLKLALPHTPGVSSNEHQAQIPLEDIMVSPKTSPRSEGFSAATSPRSAKRKSKSKSPPQDVSAGASEHSEDLIDEAIEAASDPGDSDEFDVDDFETRTIGTTSATSSIYAHTYEHGRRYQFFKNSRYPIPNDDLEQDREDMKHAMLLELLDGELFHAPIGDHPQHILDIGTGTGIWAIDVGDRFPGAKVRGIDLSPIQPVWTPPNVDFLVDDCEHDDGLGTEDVDLVHFRFMSMVLRKMPLALKNAFDCLRPGGWVELQELHGVPMCDDGTMPADDPVRRAYDLAGQAFTRFGMNVRLAAGLGAVLEEAGFVNVHCTLRKVPIGPWARDKTLRVVGYYQKQAVENILPSLAGRPFAALGMNPVESQLVAASARKALDDPGAHRYFEYYFWWAQKPDY